MKKNIIQVVVGLPVEGPFDYSVNDDMLPHILVGKRVIVSFNRRKMIGVIVGQKSKSKFKRLNTIIDILDEEPSLNTRSLKFTKEFSKYYGCSWGEAIETYLPSFLRKGRYIVSKTNINCGNYISEEKSSYSKILLTSLNKENNWNFLCNKIKENIDKTLGIIFLVPEVSQIKGIVIKLKGMIDCPIAVIDKRINTKQQKEQWEKIRTGKIKLVVGTRSAIFSPVCNLGLIIITKEDDLSYKQEQSPFYCVNKLADIRSKIEKCDVIYETTVPSVETYFYHRKSIKNDPAKNNIILSNINVVDMANYNPRKTSIISFPLQSNIRKAIDNKERVLILMNRKGFSTMTSCNQCGFTMKCPRCNVNLIFIKRNKMLVCSRCNFMQELPDVCPDCRGSYMRSVGIGIEKLANELARLYPDAKVCIFDKNSKIIAKECKIIAATQSIFKIINDINISISAILNFDAELNRFDFHSSHRAFSKLINLRLLSKKVFVQTRIPNNFCIKYAQTMDLQGFYKKELELRKELDLPPYKKLIEIVLRGKNEETIIEYSNKMFSSLKSYISKEIDIIGPYPDIIPKLRDNYRYIIMLKGKSITNMLNIIKIAKKEIKKRNLIITVNVDP